MTGLEEKKKRLTELNDQSLTLFLDFYKELVEDIKHCEKCKSLKKKVKNREDILPGLMAQAVFCEYHMKLSGDNEEQRQITVKREEINIKCVELVLSLFPEIPFSKGYQAAKEFFDYGGSFRKGG